MTDMEWFAVGCVSGTILTLIVTLVTARSMLRDTGYSPQEGTENERSK